RYEQHNLLALPPFGVGNIGTALMQQLQQQRAYLLPKGFDVTVVGLADSKRFALAPEGINLSRWKETLAAARHRMTPATFAEHIAGLELTNVALVDCTANPSIVDAYPAFINQDLHI